jgi:hypothetical protein
METLETRGGSETSALPLIAQFERGLIGQPVAIRPGKSRFMGKPAAVEILLSRQPGGSRDQRDSPPKPKDCFFVFQGERGDSWTLLGNNGCFVPFSSSSRRAGETTAYIINPFCPASEGRENALRPAADVVVVEPAEAGGDGRDLVKIIIEPDGAVKVCNFAAWVDVRELTPAEKNGLIRVRQTEGAFSVPAIRQSRPRDRRAEAVIRPTALRRLSPAQQQEQAKRDSFASRFALELKVSPELLASLRAQLPRFSSVLALDETAKRDETARRIISAFVAEHESIGKDSRIENLLLKYWTELAPV